MQVRAIYFLAFLSGVTWLTALRAVEPIVGGGEGCDGVFQGLPDSLAATARIAPANEPGQPMRLSGRVLRPDGTPAAGMIVYAYHTNAGGVYPKDTRHAGQSAERHGLLRGWVKTDGAGRYQFDTIRPGGYPNATIPAHVHMHVLEPGRCTYYIDDVVFTDDPRLTTSEIAGYAKRGGTGVTTPRRDANNTWLVERDIKLGENVPGYPK